MKSKNDLFLKANVKKLFNSVSSSYNSINLICSLGYSNRWRNRCIKNLPNNNNNILVADLMCGRGECWPALFKKFPNAKLTAVDFSERMLAIAQKRNLNTFNNQIHLWHCDILNTVFPKNHFDIVICAFGIKTISPSEIPALTNSIYNMLKPGASFSIIDTSIPQNKIAAWCFRVYLKHFIPLIGKIFANNPHYDALYHYTQIFNNAQSIMPIFNAAGLSSQYFTYSGACVSGISGTKPL